MKILAIGSHPDDVEIGCAGTLARLSSHGEEVYLLVLSDGEKGGDPDTRRKEALLSSSAFDAKQLFFGELPDTDIGHNYRTIHTIEKIVNEIAPQIVFTHNPYDVHQDHIAVGMSTLAAAREVNNILFYESPPLSRQFDAKLFVDISTTVDTKRKCLGIFRSQISHRHFSVDAIIALSKFRGNQVGLPYAEAYGIFRIVVKQVSHLCGPLAES